MCCNDVISWQVLGHTPIKILTCMMALEGKFKDHQTHYNSPRGGEKCVDLISWQFVTHITHQSDMMTGFCVKPKKKDDKKIEEDRKQAKQVSGHFIKS